MPGTDDNKEILNLFKEKIKGNTEKCKMKTVDLFQELMR